MNEERKKLCLYAGINFLIGAIMGTVLFYAHFRSNPQSIGAEYYFEKNLQVIDVLRAWWMNVMWSFSVFLAHTVLPGKAVHTIVGLRGAVSSFSVLYLMETFGVNEAVVSVLPQCLSVIPMLMCFSVLCVEKRMQNVSEGKEAFHISRGTTILLFLFCALAALGEAATFALLSRILL